MTVRDKHIQGSPFKVNVLHSGEAYLSSARKGARSPSSMAFLAWLLTMKVI